MMVLHKLPTLRSDEDEGSALATAAKIKKYISLLDNTASSRN
jgi:hypothetical protein